MKKYNLEHYQNQSVAEGVSLLQNDDIITFSVLASILQGNCASTYTNHKSIVICHSTSPFPVWVWCKDVTNAEDIKSIAACLKEAFPLEAGFTYNIGYDTMNYLKEVDSYFTNSEIKMNLLSYRLDDIKEIDYPCDGRMEPVRAEDEDYLVKLWHDLCLEMEGTNHDEEHCRNRIKRHLNDKTLFSWRNDANEIVALTSRGDVDKYSKISAVYTLPEHRRKGYAINLVRTVTQMILNDNLVPILYTNADYGASNSCYKKIGYEQVGSLCTVCRK